MPAIPYLTKSTETALSQVPSSYRERAEALGLPTTRALRRIVVKAAPPGIVTGLLVAIAISVSKTAPPLLTANWSLNEPSLQNVMNAPVRHLTFRVWTFFKSPYKAQQYLAYDAALPLFVLVLIIILGRMVVALFRRNAE